MEEEVLSSSSSYTDDDQKNLMQLLDEFGSMVSLEDIASAYCQADRNVDATGEILRNMKDSTSGSSMSKSQDYLESRGSLSSGCLSDTLSENAHITKSKQKKSSASIGTISGVIGKEYIKPRSQRNEPHKNHKPVKLYSDDIPVSEIWDEIEVLESTSKGESMNHEVEEFLLAMLGNGFHLDRSVIQDVVGQCGYNMQMSVDKLLDLSAATLEKSDDVITVAAGNTMKTNLDLEFITCDGKSPIINYSERAKSKNDIQIEVLESLFCVPGTIEENQESTRPLRRESQRSPYGRVVAKPPEETLIEDFTFITRQPVNSRNDEANENDYDVLRKAVMEYWMTMKEYYIAAVDAFTKADYEKAQKFLEEGHFFMKKAREADEKSAQVLIGNSDEQEEFSLNVHYLEPKDAVHHLKLHLTSFSGFSSIPYLKVVVGTNGEDSKERRRKRLITKLLEKEGIPWTEEGNGWTISIQIDEVDPKKLSFANK